MRAAALLLTFAILAPPAFGQPKKLMVIHSYAPNTWTRNLDLGIKKVTRQAWAIDTYFYHSAYWSTRPAAEQAREKEKILGLLVGRKPDQIILVDNEAADFLADAIGARYPKVILTGINASRSDTAWLSFCQRHPEARVILEEYPYAEALQALKRLTPKAKTFSAFGADASTSERLLSGLRSFVQGPQGSLRLRREIKSNSWEAWKDELARAKAEDDFIWIFVPFGVKDRLNEEVTPDRLGQWLLANFQTRRRIGSDILGKAVDVSIGLSSVDLGVETATLLSGRAPRAPGTCLYPSKSYRIRTSNSAGKAHP